MKRFFYVLAFFIVSFVAQDLCASNCLKKVFFHQGLMVDKLVFYCSSNPVMTTSNTNQGCKTTYRCEFVATNGQDASCQERISYINTIQKKKAKSRNVPYRIHINIVEKSPEKVALVIVYDAEQIELQRDEFTTISNRPAVVFTLIHKNAMEKQVVKKQKCRWQSLEEIKKDRKIRVVIDPGHGGADAGACGRAGAVEKDIALSVSKMLQSELLKKGFEVSLTRSSDVFVPLDERTALTNLIAEADLFVSIHCNAAVNGQASGLETFHVSPVKGSTEFDALANMFSNQGKQLATNIQDSIKSTLKDDGNALKDRGVKNAFSQVLMGVEAPAALVELGFVTNEREAQHLVSNSYQRQLVNGIVDGIQSYVDRI